MAAIRVVAPAEEPFHSVASLAKKLAISERTVREMLNRGELPWYRVGAQRRIGPADVKRWLDARRQNG